MTALAPDCFYCERGAQWLVTNLTEARAACGHHVETAKDSDVATVSRLDGAAVREAFFEEAEHPRDRLGKWTHVLGMVKPPYSQKIGPGLRYKEAHRVEATANPSEVVVGPKFFDLTPGQRQGVLAHEVGHYFDDRLMTRAGTAWVWDEREWRDADGVPLNGPGAAPGERVADAISALLTDDRESIQRWPAIRRVGGALGLSEAFEEILHPRGRGGRWIFKGKIWEEEGRLGDRSHITRTEHGEISTDAIAHLRGVRGEVPGAHRNKTGAAWTKFVDEVRPGIREPIFVTVDHGDEPKISEGNHRRDAAVEAGLETVPVEIRYFGHAEREGTVLDRARAREPDAESWTEEADALVAAMRQFLTLRAHNLRERAREMHYLGWEDLVLKHGLLFRHGPTQSRIEREFHATTAKQCFTNALMAAVENPDLTYVEGFAFNGLLPVHHAWVVDKEGQVYDPTWENIEGRDATHDVYLGVPFTTDYVTKTVMGKGTDTLMDEWGEGVKLTEPLPSDAVESGVRGVPVPEHLHGPDADLLAELQGHKIGESVFDPFKHPRGRLGRWIGTLGERERHAVERAVSHPARMVEPDELLRSAPRGRGGKGRKGLKGKASEWRALVDAARAEGVLPSVELRRQLSDALKRQHGEEDDKFLDSWFGRGTGTGSRGLIQTTSGDPGVLFEEQHDRIMRAGAAIDAEVERRNKEAVQALKAAQKEHRDAKRDKKQIVKEDERLRAEVAVEILKRSGWYDEEFVREMNEPQAPAVVAAFGERPPYDPVENALKRWQSFQREKAKDRRMLRGERKTGGAFHILHGPNREVATAFYAAENDQRVVDSGERRSGAGIRVFEAEMAERKARRALNIARRDAAYELLREVRPIAEPGTLKVEAAYPGQIETQAVPLLRLVDATRFLPQDWVEASNRAVEDRGRPLVAALGERGRYTREVQLNEGDEPKDLITGSEPTFDVPDAEGVGPGVGVMLHELVHRAEDTHDGIKGAEWVFYTSRVSPGANRRWEDAVSLRGLTGADSYREGEVTRPDDFIEPYSGKEYPGDEMTRPYEILTTGIEDLVTGEHKIIEQDPEYRQFVYGALAIL